MRTNTLTKVIATAGVAGLALTGCSQEGELHENGDEKQVTIGVFTGWPESEVPSELWKAVLEEQGYDVTIERADPAPIFTGVQSGDYDFTTNVWLPNTHKNYMDEYGEDLVDLGVWNENGAITLSVNEDAPITSLEELADHADEFDNQIIGIEPGAGQTEITQNDVIPAYGLEGMEYVLSSTPGMLTSLDDAIANGDNIVVTLWRPHWAYDEYPIRDLEDPQGMLGGQEEIHIMGTSDFEETHPQVAEWLGEFEFEDELFNGLANEMFNEYSGDDYGPIVEAWVEEHRDYVDSLTAE
ncbi:glycine betaine ABC transporter substrate-binding protein [Gulosibacter sp. 10]|uniref:glycine betaine ABC transporter substrate-binding protein n=1 Tax=Gulosibacter sp. 10 TaxID=1255570 RepID=UPI00097ECB78|nr:glycine betaine ABC transporter substrate-binding protein [Gulosibacter sp. 10]SJM50748.1 L-proline glycine betaine ABC transport system permease protein ProW (TC 3.A.1.12.1) [Gulosibacter sp. 10]